MFTSQGVAVRGARFSFGRQRDSAGRGVPYHHPTPERGTETNGARGLRRISARRPWSARSWPPRKWRSEGTGVGYLSLTSALLLWPVYQLASDSHALSGTEAKQPSVRAPPALSTDVTSAVSPPGPVHIRMGLL